MPHPILDLARYPIKYCSPQTCIGSGDGNKEPSPASTVKPNYILNVIHVYNTLFVSTNDDQTDAFLLENL